MQHLTEKDINNTIEYLKTNYIENVAENLLFILGFKSNLSGTKYLVDAIVLKYNTGATYLSRDIYPQIAQKYNTEPARVERSIRHAINECYESGNLARINDLYGTKLVDARYSPTTSEFLSEICTWIHIKKGDKYKN